MKVIGLTGSFGTGKSFVAALMKKHPGVKVLDADGIAHDVIKKGRPAYKKIIDIFGTGILAKNKNIDRKKLGKIVFADRSKLKKLNAIVHPKVISIIKKAIAAAGKNDTVVIDAPLLVEAGLHRIADILIVVKCSKKKQIVRCSRKYKMGRKDIVKRIKNQIPLKRKVAMADFVVNNEGTESDTKKEVRKVWRKIWR